MPLAICKRKIFFIIENINYSFTHPFFENHSCSFIKGIVLRQMGTWLLNVLTVPIYQINESRRPMPALPWGEKDTRCPLSSTKRPFSDVRFQRCSEQPCEWLPLKRNFYLRQYPSGRARSAFHMSPTSHSECCRKIVWSHQLANGSERENVNLFEVYRFSQPQWLKGNKPKTWIEISISKK